MLLCKYFVEQCLINGLFGSARTKYGSTALSWASSALMYYVVVEFFRFFIREYYKFFSDKLSNWALIHMVKFQCEFFLLKLPTHSEFENESLYINQRW